MNTFLDLVYCVILDPEGRKGKGKKEGKVFRIKQQEKESKQKQI